MAWLFAFFIYSSFDMHAFGFFVRVLIIKNAKGINSGDNYFHSYQQISGKYVVNNLLGVQYTAHLIRMIF